MYAHGVTYIQFVQFIADKRGLESRAEESVTIPTI